MLIEVVLAMPEKQALIKLDLPAGTKIADAIAQSGLGEMFAGFDIDTAQVGIFGQKASREQVLQAGDRVEIYRPLLADPKETRRQRALKQAQK